ncbi:hypothetical protein, partial [Streptomyces noursei]
MGNHTRGLTKADRALPGVAEFLERQAVVHQLRQQLREAEEQRDIASRDLPLSVAGEARNLT